MIDRTTGELLQEHMISDLLEVVAAVRGLKSRVTDFLRAGLEQIEKCLDLTN